MSFTFRYHLSTQGRNLIVAIVGGLVAGTILNSLGLTNLFIQDNYLVMHGWVVPLITSIFVAPPILIGFLDVFFNAISVYFLDPLFTNIYTPRQYYTTFIVAGVFGNILSLLNGPLVASFGASGGIFGLLGGALAYDYSYNRRVNGTFIGWFLFVFLYSSLGGADVYAHLGGALAGLIIGYYLGTKRRTAEIRGTMWRYGYP